MFIFPRPIIAPLAALAVSALIVALDALSVVGTPEGLLWRVTVSARSLPAVHMLYQFEWLDVALVVSCDNGCWDNFGTLDRDMRDIN